MNILNYINTSGNNLIFIRKTLYIRDKCYHMAVNENEKVIKNSLKQDKRLRKALTTWDLYFLSLGGIIGSGWLFAAAAASSTAGPAAIISWLIGGIIVLFIALVYAELGSMIPRSGAISRYGHYSHGGVAGLFFGWTYFLSAVSVPTIEAEAVITYAGSYIHGLSYSAVNPLYPAGPPLLLLSGYGIGLAAILIVAFFGLNYMGVRLMGKTNTGMTWWKLIIPIGTIILMGALVFHSSNFNNPALGGFLIKGHTSYIFQAVSTDGIVFAFLGFRQALDYGGEAKTPQRSIPRATIFSVLTGIVVYVLLQVIFIGAINPTKLAAAGGFGVISSAASGYAFDVASAPFAFLAKSSGILILAVLTYILYADAYVSPSGTLNVYAGTSTRTLFGLAENGYFPAALGKVNKKTGVPVYPILISLIIGLIFLAPFPSWYALVGLITGATAFTYIVGGSALMVFRREADELKRPFKLPYAKILAPVAFVGASLIVYWTGWPTVGYLSIGIFLGIVVYSVMLLTHKVNNVFTAQNIKAGYWVPLYIIVLVILSYLGETGYGGTNVFPYPYDFIVVILVAIIFYLLSIHSGYKTEEISDIIESGTQYITEEESTAPAGKK